jgi:acetyl esterase
VNHFRSVVAVGLLLLAGLCAAQQPDKPKVRDFVYKKVKNVELSLFVHTSNDWNKADKRPVIVFFFGGGWTGGNVDQFEPQARYFAQRGLVAVRADYRVKSRHDVTPVECVEDAKSAVRWLRQNADKLGIDPDAVVAAGGSAGGHLAACTALCPTLDADGEDLQVSSRPNALVLFNPVLRFDSVPQLMSRIGKDAQVGKRISPTLHLAKDSPPVILFFGKDDPLMAQCDEFVAKAKKLGHKTELFIADGVGHGFFNKSPWQERTLRRADEFLGSLEYLQGEPAIKDR